MERLKKAFSTKVGDGADPVVAMELLTCDGPGVMLIELASRCDAARLQMETNVFQCIEESIELDMQDTILLVDTHATVACDGAKSSVASLKNERAGPHAHAFLENCREHSNFEMFIEIRHIIVLQHSAEEHTQLPDDSIIDGASSSETFAL
jgi:hypothetical protein